MDHEDGQFTGKNGIELYYQSWKNKSENKGTVIICHGFGEHSGRHINLANILVESGFSVYALDHRGHGRSKGKQNYVKRFTDYFNDLELFLKFVKEKEQGPFHLFGHSMGSIIAGNYLGTYDEHSNFKSLILAGTGSAPGPAIGKGVQVLSKVLSKLLPSLSVASGLDPEFISHDPEVVQAYVDDPLVNYKKITTRLASELLVYTKKMNISAKKIKIPTLIVVGGEDETFHPDSWPILLESLGSTKKDLIIYDGLRHEICNELENERPLNDICNWIKENN